MSEKPAKKRKDLDYLLICLVFLLIFSFSPFLNRHVSAQEYTSNLKQTNQSLKTRKVFSVTSQNLIGGEVLGEKVEQGKKKETGLWASIKSLLQKVTSFFSFFTTKDEIPNIFEADPYPETPPFSYQPPSQPIADSDWISFGSDGFIQGSNLRLIQGSDGGLIITGPNGSQTLISDSYSKEFILANGKLPPSFIEEANNAELALTRQQEQARIQAEAEKAAAEQKAKEAEQQSGSPWDFTLEGAATPPPKQSEASPVSEGEGGRFFGPEDVKEYETALEISRTKAEAEQATPEELYEPTSIVGASKTAYKIVSNIAQGILDRFSRSSEIEESEKVEGTIPGTTQPAPRIVGQAQLPEWQKRAEVLIKQRQDKAIEAAKKIREEELQSKPEIDFSINSSVFSSTPTELSRQQGVFPSEILTGSTLTTESIAPQAEVEEMSFYQFLAETQRLQEEWEQSKRIRDLAFLGAFLAAPVVAGSLAAAPIVSSASLYAYIAGTTALATAPRWVQQAFSYGTKGLDIAGKALDVAGCASGDQAACAGGAVGLQMELMQPVIKGIRGGGEYYSAGGPREYYSRGGHRLIVDLDSPELQRFLDEASEFVSKERTSSSVSKASLVGEFVNTKISYNIGFRDEVFELGKTTANLSDFCKKGVCQEMSVMGHTILAREGIPSEVVIGDVGIESLLPSVRHAWVEYFDIVSGDMVMDPTRGFNLPIEEAYEVYQGVGSKIILQQPLLPTIRLEL